MRNVESYFRKPVSFAQYHFVIVKSHGIWCLDCGSWDYEEIRTYEKETAKVEGEKNVKLCSSPSDDERVVQRIIKAMNRG